MLSKNLGFKPFDNEIEKSISERVSLLDQPRYELLMAFIPYFESRPSYQWGGGRQPDGTLQLPFPIYDDQLSQFEQCFYMSGAADQSYMETLNRYGVRADHDSFRAAIPTADEALLRAMLTCYIRQERFCDGILAAAVENENMAGILKRIQAMLN